MPQKDRSLNKTERLFALVLLLQNRPSMTSRDLADHFGVSRRTIFRDLRTLAESGVPLTYADDGGYEILEGYQLPPLMFTAREAATLLIGTSFTRIQSDASLRTDADAVALKIRSVLPETIREYVDRLQERTVIGPYLHDPAPVNDPTNDGRWFELSQAVARQRSVWLNYFVSSRQELTKRKVDPLGLVFYSETWNLIAYDHLRKAVRNFRLDRIRKLSVLMDTFSPPHDFDLQQYLHSKGTLGDAREIHLRFSGESSRRARRSVPAEATEIEQPDGSVDFRFLFENLDYLANWLLRFGRDAEVIEPAELRSLTREYASELVAHHTA